MIYLVTGGSGSGKSEYAEQLLCDLCRQKGGGEKYYIATMIPYGEETKQKIARHREMRKEKAFHTRECYLDLKKFVTETFAKEKFVAEEPRTGSAQRQTLQSVQSSESVRQRFVLLECMSNLVANELFEPEGVRFTDSWNQENRTARACPQTADFLANEIAEGVMRLSEECEDLVVVTNEVCSESMEDSPEMRFYKQVLAGVNRRLAKAAVQVTEVVYGQPVLLKQSVKEKDRLQKYNKDYEEAAMRLIIGGAFQGKLYFAKTQYPDLVWADGETCEMDALVQCGGMYHLEAYIRRRMQAQTEQTIAEEILADNPGVVLVCREIGYGLVPVDAFERNYREQVGRICTGLAKHAQSVERVICGIAVRIK